jgi:hypothetical protein
MDQNRPTTESDQLALLRQLLLREERSLIDKHETLFEKEDELDQKIGPIIEAHLDLMRSKFPEQYNKHVDQMIVHRIANSKDEIIGAIYPELGRMIKKYVQFQIEQLRESIALQVAESKQSIFFWRRKKSAAAIADHAIAHSIPTKVEQVFLIKYPEGTIISHASAGESLAPEAVAGMLTALKAFITDAFEKQEQQMQFIQYDTQVLLLEHYHSYYFAALLSGPITKVEQELISEKMYNFLQAEFITMQQAQSATTRKVISQRLSEYFELENTTTY